MTKPILPSSIFVDCPKNNCGDPIEVMVLGDKIKIPNYCKTCGALSPTDEDEIERMALMQLDITPR